MSFLTNGVFSSNVCWEQTRKTTRRQLSSINLQIGHNYASLSLSSDVILSIRYGMSRQVEAMRLLLVLTIVCSVMFRWVECDEEARSFALSSSGKPLVKRPFGGTFKVVLFVGGGGSRGIVGTMSIIELEQSIKRYLLDHPAYLPADAAISTMDDFDINLADYIDCMTGMSGGTWTALYLASRGGQGASRKVLDDPEIVTKYGVIPTGGAEGLRVFYREYSSVIYPFDTLDPAAGQLYDITNPQAPGVSSPVFPLDGLETALEAFLGNTTLTDLDSSVLIPTVDLITGYTVFFVQNTFKDPHVSSSARLISRSGPRAPPNEGGIFVPDLTFDEGKDYYLKDVGSAAGAPPLLHPAKQMSQVGNDTIEYLLVDGVFPFEITSLPAAYFVSAESGLLDLQKVAVLSIANGLVTSDLSSLANAGATGWLEGFQVLTLFINSGARSLSSLVDYIYYSNPATLPYQYLRVQREEPNTTETGMLLSNIFDLGIMDNWEAIGRSIAEEHRSSIDAFVKDFIFG